METHARSTHRRSRFHQNDLRHARHAGRVDGEQHPVPRHGDARVRGHLERIGVGARGERGEGDAALVRVDGVRGGTRADQGEGGDGAVGDRGEGAAYVDGGGGDAGDDGPGGGGAGGGEEVWRGEDLGVEVVVGAVGAEAATTAEDGGVGQEEGDGVVVAAVDHEGHGLEGLGGGGPEFGREDGVVVVERVGVLLAADDEDGAVGEDDGVGEGAAVGHAGQGLDGGGIVDAVQRDEVDVVGRHGVLVGCGAAEGQDLAGDGVDHHRVAAHGVGVGGAVSGGFHSSVAAGGGVPVHGHAGAGLEDRAVAPREEPAVVVGAIDALGVVGEHGCDRIARQQGPGVVGIRVDLAVLAAFAAGPRSANGPDATVGQRGLRLITAGNLHDRENTPCGGRGSVDADLICVVTPSDEGFTSEVHGQPWTEHVVLCVCNFTLCDNPGGDVVGGRISLSTWRVVEIIAFPGGPDKDITG